MPRNRNQVVPNPEAFTRHNIAVWRSMGYSDWEIGYMMRPRLSTPDEFEYWGLEWSPPPAILLLPDPHDDAVEAKHERLEQAIDEAIEGEASVSRTVLCRQACVGSDTFKRICIEYPHIYAKWERLKELNRVRGTIACKEFLQISRARAAKLDEAAALLDKTIAAGQPTSMTQLSKGVGRSRNWLQMLCREGYGAALRLRERVFAHNRQINCQKQSA
jgi:hypothetical protein